MTFLTFLSLLVLLALIYILNNRVNALIKIVEKLQQSNANVQNETVDISSYQNDLATIASAVNTLHDEVEYLKFVKSDKKNALKEWAKKFPKVEEIKAEIEEELNAVTE